MSRCAADLNVFRILRRQPCSVHSEGPTGAIGSRPAPEPAVFPRLGETTAPAATVLIRILVGWVFVSEGVQKFLFPDDLGVGRFIKSRARARNHI
jgi:hypothetical protein